MSIACKIGLRPVDCLLLILHTATSLAITRPNNPRNDQSQWRAISILLTSGHDKAHGDFTPCLSVTELLRFFRIGFFDDLREFIITQHPELVEPQSLHRSFVWQLAVMTRQQQ